MSNYTKATNFATKDALLTGNPAKIIKGTEIDDEYNAIAVAVSTKADLNSPTFTGTPLAPTATPGTNTTQVATTAFVQAEIASDLTTERSATATLTNKTISADSNTLSGIAASSFVLSNASGNIDGSAAQKAIPSGVVVGDTDTQTLTNKTINASQLVDASITTAKIADANITASKLDGAQSGSAPIYGARAWVNFDGTTTPPTIRASGNVTSVTKNGTGDYTVNFTTAMADSDYAALTSTDNGNATNNNTSFMPFPTTPFTTTSARFVARLSNGTLVDRSFCSVTIFR